MSIDERVPDGDTHVCAAPQEGCVCFHHLLLCGQRCFRAIPKEHTDAATTGTVDDEETRQCVPSDGNSTTRRSNTTKTRREIYWWTERQSTRKRVSKKAHLQKHGRIVKRRQQVQLQHVGHLSLRVSENIGSLTLIQRGESSVAHVLFFVRSWCRVCFPFRLSSPTACFRVLSG